MQIANRSLLSPVVEGTKDHTIKDEKYRITAIPVTTSRFGPSGSLNSRNIALEHTRDVIPRISNDVFFELKDMFCNHTPRSCVQNYVHRPPPTTVGSGLAEKEEGLTT